MTSSIYIVIVVQLIVNQTMYCSLADSRQRIKQKDDSDDVRASNVAAVKSVLLNVLGLKSEPVRGSVSYNREAVPDFMWQLYRRQLAENRRLQRVSAANSGGSETDHSKRNQQEQTTSTVAYGGNTIRSFVATTQLPPSVDQRRQQGY
jgi:TGF-beta propeptide